MDSGPIEGLLADAERAFLASGAVSLSVAVGLAGDVAAAGAWGLADADRRVPATTDTAYLLASVTKPITATAVALLVEEGLLAYEAPLGDVLGYQLRQFAPGPEPTVADLLAHRGGIGHYYRFYYEDGDARPEPDFRVTAARHAVVTTVPGRHYQYSNLGYGVLDHVIETVTSEPAPAFVASSIFEPLGLSSAFVGPRDLSHDLGVPGDTQAPLYLEAIDRVRSAAQQFGKSCGLLVPNGAAAAEKRAQGWTFVGVGSDATLLATALTTELASARTGDQS